MTNWQKYGPEALVIRHRPTILEIISILEEWISSADRRQIDEALWKRINAIRASTGIIMGYDVDKVIVSWATTEILKVDFDNLTRRKLAAMKTYLSTDSKKLWSLSNLMQSTNGLIRIETYNDMRRVMLELATAADRHEAFKRYALPNLRASANHTILLDRMAVGLLSRELTGSQSTTLEERIACVRQKLEPGQYLKRNESLDTLPVRRIGNILLGNSTLPSVIDGKVKIKGAITSAQAIHYIGKKLGDMVEGHHCSDVGLLVRKITVRGDTLEITTNSLDTHKLIPLNIAA